MKLAVLVALLTTSFSLIVKFIGLPDQIRVNYRRKSTEGVSTLYFILGFISYVLWGIHGYLAHDWALMISQGVAGVVTTGFILWQIYIYRMRKLGQSKPVRKAPRWYTKIFEDA
jgi:uncharacterized protein with PQ loop repeat